ncbi:hypothetical protein [uncultured Tessaracoccus sp.]|uniref:hypothetical protein n=1 Tax=uncultured Tessaracoccus sp. TaxID=905023 RepID=UPI002617879C|nr:hypothetical protein [uncultured Tessaracoccus sp.]
MTTTPMTTVCVASPRTAEDAVHTLMHGLNDPLMSPLAVHRAACIMQDLMRREPARWARLAGIMLHGVGLAAHVERPGVSVSFPGYVHGNPPDDGDGGWGVWAGTQRLGLERSDWGAEINDDLDPDTTPMLSSLPPAVDGVTTVLATLATNATLLDCFCALRIAAATQDPERERSVIGQWHAALRIVCWIARERGRLADPSILPTIARVATDTEECEPEEVTGLLELELELRAVPMEDE